MAGHEKEEAEGQAGRMSAGQAAEVLELHVRTIRRYVTEGRFTNVVRDSVGRIWIAEAEVREMATHGWREPERLV